MFQSEKANQLPLLVIPCNKQKVFPEPCLYLWKQSVMFVFWNNCYVLLLVPTKDRQYLLSWFFFHSCRIGLEWNFFISARDVSRPICSAPTFTTTTTNDVEIEPVLPADGTTAVWVTEPPESVAMSLPSDWWEFAELRKSGAEQLNKVKSSEPGNWL